MSREMSFWTLFAQIVAFFMQFVSNSGLEDYEQRVRSARLLVDAMTDDNSGVASSSQPTSAQTMFECEDQ
jgi:hypothetical protein